MRGDFTRNTFDPARNYSRVLMQQGRVALDADWNEQTSILLHYMRNLVADVFGPHAGPLLDCGFQIIAPLGTTWKNAVNKALGNLLTPDEIAKLTDRMGNDGDFLILPGRYYVGGLPLTLTRPMLYSDQLGYSAFTGDSTLAALKATKLPYLLYLDVWEQHITALEDDAIREVALGGPDTCTRAKVHWQIRAVIRPETLAGNDPAGQPKFSCNYADTLPPLGTGKIRARARLDKPPTELCAIPPESRYRGLENQLYRVEIHNSGIGAAWPVTNQPKGQAKTNLPAQPDAPVAGAATFVWSREDGSVVLPLASLADPTAVVTFLGRDRRLSLEQGDLVEVMDDALAACGVSGPLAVVQTVDRDRMTVTLQFAKAAAAPSYSEDDVDTLHPRLIRWDNKPGDMTGDGALRVLEPADDADLKTGWIDLEDGVQIRFATGGSYQEGGYWLIPARTITGDVDWPHEPKPDPDGNPIAMALGARGVDHFYAPLGLVTPGGTDGGQAALADCRCVIQRMKCMTNK